MKSSTDLFCFHNTINNSIKERQINSMVHLLCPQQHLYAPFDPWIAAIGRKTGTLHTRRCGRTGPASGQKAVSAVVGMTRVDQFHRVGLLNCGSTTGKSPLNHVYISAHQSTTIVAQHVEVELASKKVLVHGQRERVGTRWVACCPNLPPV